MDSTLKQNNNISQLTNENYTSLNTISTNNTEIVSTPNKNDKFKNILLKIIEKDNSLNLKSKYFYQWKNPQKKSNLRSIKILKFQRKKLKFDLSPEKLEEIKSPLKGKININLFKRLINKQNDKLKYFFQKWKNMKYVNKSGNYNFRKREIKKIKILPKKKSSEIFYPRKDDDLYNHIINLLNKFDKSQRKKELLYVLSKIEEIEKNSILKTYNSNDSFFSEGEKNINNLKSKIKERAFNRIKNVIEKNDIKQKFFNRWKQLTTFSSKSIKSVKRLNRIIFTKKQKEPNLTDYEIQSHKTYDNIINLRLQNKEESNELNNYILRLYKAGDKTKQNYIKNMIKDILKLLQESKTQIQTPSTPYNDSSFSYSFFDVNTDRSEEDSNISMKNMSRRIYKRLRTIFEKIDVKMHYFNKWKENVKYRTKKIRKRLMLNKQEKENLMKRFITSNLFTRNIKIDTDKKNKDEKNNEKTVNKQAPKIENEQKSNINNNVNDYLYNNTDFSELEENPDNDILNKTKFKKLDIINTNNEITPKKYRNSNHIRFNTDFKLDVESSFGKDNTVKRSSATPGRYKMSFKKVFLTRSKTQNSSEKKSKNKTLAHITKKLEIKYLKKYFDIWKKIEEMQNSENESDKEEILEIIKTNDIILENSNSEQEKDQGLKNNENEKNDEIKCKNSSLNSIYGICITQDFVKNKNKEECISIYGNKKSNEINDNIQPNFNNFLKAINSSIATFNLFTYYSQFHDNKFLIKKKFLPIWRNIKSF